MENNREIYSFDFDGTIVTSEFPNIGKPIERIIELIHFIKNKGDYLILNTMREGELLNDAVVFCESIGIVFDEVNNNLPHLQKAYGNNPRKVFANYYIDDHNLYIDEINADKLNVIGECRNEKPLTIDELREMVFKPIYDQQLKTWYLLTHVESAVYKELNHTRNSIHVIDTNKKTKILHFDYGRFYKNEI